MTTVLEDRRDVLCPFYIQDGDSNTTDDAGSSYVGRSYKSLKAQIEPTIQINSDDLRVEDSSGGSSTIKLISTYSSLRTFLNVKAEASGGFSGVEAKARAEYLHETKSSKYKLFIALKKRVESRWAHLPKGYYLNQQFAADLSSSNEEIYKKYGDSFVAEAFFWGGRVRLHN